VPVREFLAKFWQNFAKNAKRLQPFRRNSLISLEPAKEFGPLTCCFDISWGVLNECVYTKKDVDSMQSLVYLIIGFLYPEVIHDIKPGEKQPLHTLRQAVKP